MKESTQGEKKYKHNPGSEEALKQGCTCPVLDNAHGKGGLRGFYISGDCPLHNKQKP